MICARCGSPDEPCLCENARTFVRARAYDYYLPQDGMYLRNISNTSPAAGARGSSAAAGLPLISQRTDEPAVCALGDWHTLYLAWRQQHPDARGVAWHHSHGPHDATAERGPLRRTTNRGGAFTVTQWQLRTQPLWWSDKDRHGGVCWDGAA